MTSMYDVLRASKGLPVDDIFAELWGRKLSSDYTITTYTGTLPATLTGTKAGYLHRYKIYGNTVQDGTPTPENPIEPSECGERTGNLFNSAWEQGYISVTTGENQPSNNVVRTAGYIPVEYNKIYSMSRNLAGNNMSLRFYDAQKNYITGGSDSSDVMRLISGQNYNNPMTSNLVFCCFKITDSRVAYIRVHDYVNNLTTQYMMVEGEYTEQIMPNYIPYGYKLPLTSAGQDVNIYLGESQTTRRIKKLVLTGEENWSITSNNRLRIGMSGQLRPFAPICSHYTGSAATAWGNLLDKSITVSIAGYLAIYDTTYDNTTDFKAYLAAQYANGTPVTVWYVLATEETGTLNEPLCKIGNYADTIDSTQTSAQIPTSAGSTTISWAGSGLAPSQFDSIQEWVDIPTYKRVNGEWVADN